jgi:hypothetical protein
MNGIFYKKSTTFFLKITNSFLFVFLGGVQKPKSLSSFFGVCLVVNVVCMHDAFHVFTFGRKFEFYSSVHNQIMKNEIEKPVKGNA